MFGAKISRKQIERVTFSKWPTSLILILSRFWGWLGFNFFFHFLVTKDRVETEELVNDGAPVETANYTREHGNILANRKRGK